VGAAVPGDLGPPKEFACQDTDIASSAVQIDPLPSAPEDAEATSGIGQSKPLPMAPKDADIASGAGQVDPLSPAPGNADKASGVGQSNPLPLDPKDADIASGTGQIDPLPPAPEDADDADDASSAGQIQPHPPVPEDADATSSVKQNDSLTPDPQFIDPPCDTVTEHGAPPSAACEDAGVPFRGTQIDPDHDERVEEQVKASPSEGAAKRKTICEWSIREAPAAEADAEKCPAVLHVDGLARERKDSTGSELSTFECRFMSAPAPAPSVPFAAAAAKKKSVVIDLTALRSDGSS